MSAPVYVSHTLISNTGGTTTHTIDAPADIVEGNLLLMFLFIHNAGRAVSSRPAGWAAMPWSPLDGSTEMSMFVEWKIADSGDESATDYTWELDAGGGGSQFMVQYSGVNGSNPFNDDDGTNTASGTTHTTPTITTNVNGCLILSAFSLDSSGGNSWSGGGDTERLDVDGSFGVVSSIYESLQATAGSVSKTATCTGSDPAEVCIIALEPETVIEMSRPIQIQRSELPIRQLRI